MAFAKKSLFLGLAHKFAVLAPQIQGTQAVDDGYILVGDGDAVEDTFQIVGSFFIFAAIQA